MLDARGSFEVVTTPPLPVEKLVIGRPVETAIAVLPRVFNLCRAAQRMAAELALGLAPAGGDVMAEIRRDHMLKLFATWPQVFGLPVTLQRAWLEDDDAALAALFGPIARVPRDDFEMQGFLGSGEGVSPLLMQIEAAFLPGEAVADGLPLVDADSAFSAGAVENSPAARRAHDPALGYVEAFHGRGPLWRAAGRVIDLGRTLENDVPAPATPRPGAALVPATRGLYAVRAHHAGGIVERFDRVTPTDHMLAPGGMLERALVNLDTTRAGLAPLLLELLDPCQPVELMEARDA